MEDSAINDNTEAYSSDVIEAKFVHPLTEVYENACNENRTDMGEGAACNGPVTQTVQQTKQLARLFLRRKMLEWSIAKSEAEVTLLQEEYKEFMLDMLAEKAHVANYLCSVYGVDTERFWWNDSNYDENPNHAQNDAEQYRDCHGHQLNLDTGTEDCKLNTTKIQKTSDSNAKMSETNNENRDMGSQSYFFLTKLIQFFMYLRKND